MKFPAKEHLMFQMISNNVILFWTYGFQNSIQEFFKKYIYMYIISHTFYFKAPQRFVAKLD